MCILFSPSGECFSTKIAPPLVIEFYQWAPNVGAPYTQRDQVEFIRNILQHNVA